MKTIAALICLSLALSLLANFTEAAPFGTETKLFATDGAIQDEFGVSVAILGNTALVGSSFDDDAGMDSGSAYLFNAATGSELIKLTASDAAALDEFGTSVSLSGNKALIGSYRDDDTANETGSAYVFNATTGAELLKLNASDAAAGDHFGFSVSIDGNTALVGARLDDDAGDASGSAYLFNATTGAQLFKLTATDADLQDQFGQSVAISGNRAIVGAFADDDGASNAGSAYIFDTDTGAQLLKLTASDGEAGNFFGWSVAISGDRAIVGSRNDNDDGNNSGSAYIFDVNTGAELFKLTASDAFLGDLFGYSVAIDGDTALVGSYLDDDAGSGSGSAYLFDVATGTELLKLTASDAAAINKFGWSVGINGNTAIVGATVNTTDIAPIAGAAYVFTPEPSSLLLVSLAGLLGQGSMLRRRS